MQASSSSSGGGGGGGGRAKAAAVALVGLGLPHSAKPQPPKMLADWAHDDVWEMHQ